MSRRNNIRQFIGILFIFALVGAFVWGQVLNGNMATAQSSTTYFLEAGGTVVMEAENHTGEVAGVGTTSSSVWQATTDFDGFTGTGAMEAAPNSGANAGLTTDGPALLYDIFFQTPGTYYVYVRGEANSSPVRGANDSVHVGLNGTAVTTIGGNGLHNFSANNFNWRNLANGNSVVTVNVPSAGFHTFYLWMREDGVVIDKIWLSMTPDEVAYGSTEAGPDESAMSNASSATPTPENTSTPTPSATPTSILHFLTATITPTPDPELSGGGDYLEVGGNVVIEAENFASRDGSSSYQATWEEVTSFAGFTGASAMQALPNTGENTGLVVDGPVLNYSVFFENPGTYYVYIRGLADSPRWDNDSIHVGVNGVPVSTSAGNGFGNFTDPNFNWRSRGNANQVVSIDIPSVGFYTFNVWMREDGVIVDKIWLSQTLGAIVDGSNAVGPDESATVSGLPTNTPTPLPTEDNPRGDEMTSTPIPSSTPTPVTPSATPTSIFQFLTTTPLPTNTPTNTPTVTNTPISGRDATATPPSSPTPTPIVPTATPTSIFQIFTATPLPVTPTNTPEPTPTLNNGR